MIHSLLAYKETGTALSCAGAQWVKMDTLSSPKGFMAKQGGTQSAMVGERDGNPPPEVIFVPICFLAQGPLLFLHKAN